MLTFRKLEHTISGSVSGKPFNITRTEAAVTFLTAAQDNNIPDSDILQFIASSKLGEIAMTNKFLVFSPITKEYFLAFEGYRSKKAIPKVLVNLIEESYDKDIDFMPIIKAWARLLNNPRYTAEMGKKGFIMVNDVKVSPEFDKIELCKEQFLNNGTIIFVGYDQQNNEIVHGTL